MFELSLYHIVYWYRGSETCLFECPHQRLGYIVDRSQDWRLTILCAATHKTERGDHDFCLSRSLYTDTHPTNRERAVTAGIGPRTSSPGVARSTNWATTVAVKKKNINWCLARLELFINLQRQSHLFLSFHSFCPRLYKNVFKLFFLTYLQIPWLFINLTWYVKESTQGWKSSPSSLKGIYQFSVTCTTYNSLWAYLLGFIFLFTRSNNEFVSPGNKTFHLLVTLQKSRLWPSSCKTNFTQKGLL